MLKGHFLLLVIANPTLALFSREPPPPRRSSLTTPRSSGTTPEVRWVNVRLDQFSTTNNATFPLRFYYNKLNATDKHVVLYVGGEWAITSDWVTDGLPYDIAAIIGGSMFYPEYRFYGETRPTATTDLENLEKYFTADHTLRDLAQFLDYIKSDAFENGQYKSGKVVLVGCSFAGTLSTWMKQAYPHLVDVVISHSGPLVLKDNFPEYLEVVSSVLRADGSEDCTATVKQAVDDIIAASATADGRRLVSKLYNTCTVLAENAPQDLFIFFNDGVILTFAHMVQYALPGDVAYACAALTNSSILSPMERMANWINANRDPVCLETRYTEKVNNKKNPSFNSTYKRGRLFTFLWCTELGWIQTTDSRSQIFNNTTPLNLFYDMCNDFYTQDFNQYRLRQNIARRNKFFGGLAQIPKYTISVQSTYDPWHGLGPTMQQDTPTTPVFILEGSSHCSATSALDDNDNEQMRQVKLAVVDKMKAFLKL